MTEKIQWVKWHQYEGVKFIGSAVYNPPLPHTSWQKILGVVARCEGTHQTTINYDNTGITFGFMQQTFTSGRLQQMLNSFKAIKLENGNNLFDDCFGIDGAKFVQFGFNIKNGQFFDYHKNRVIDPNNKADKQYISDLCLGKVDKTSYATSKDFAIALAKVFVEAGGRKDVANAQIEYAEDEFKKALTYTRPPLGDIKTLDKLLEGTWETCIPAIFFNLWQNSPGAAYKLFIPSYKFAKGDSKKYFDDVWLRLRKSQFANWSFANPENKSPRIVRIQKAIKEFYGIDLPVR